MKKLYPSSRVLPGLLIKHYLLYNSTIFLPPKFYFMQKLFTLRSFLFVCLASLFGTGLMAQPNTISNGGTYLQNFDGMTITATATLPVGWKADENTIPRTLGIYSAAQNHTDFIAGANMANPLPGGAYNFGAGTTADGNSDRALGGLNTSSNPTSVNVYFALQNTGST